MSVFRQFLKDIMICDMTMTDEFGRQVSDKDFREKSSPFYQVFTFILAIKLEKTNQVSVIQLPWSTLLLPPPLQSKYVAAKR